MSLPLTAHPIPTALISSQKVSYMNLLYFLSMIVFPMSFCHQFLLSQFGPLHSLPATLRT